MGDSDCRNGRNDSHANDASSFPPLDLGAHRSLSLSSDRGIRNRTRSYAVHCRMGRSHSLVRRLLRSRWDFDPKVFLAFERSDLMKSRGGFTLIELLIVI
ncbi:MAG: prepilin-type N-terminal cleavage/methylation domain-containing protein, partial [Candidatus Omnitrophica bacterium]|nr:prepilin-type N-terminal cleavage/methylation domain-containing protein [Candidatus Omnitrophota bacterium]